MIFVASLKSPKLKHGCLAPWNYFYKAEKCFCRERKTGADGRDRSLLSERGSFANYRKVPMVVKAAGESTGGEQLANVVKRS